MKRKDINDLYFAVGYATSVLHMLFDVEDWVRQVFDDTSFADRFDAVREEVNVITNDMLKEVRRIEKESANEEA